MAKDTEKTVTEKTVDEAQATATHAAKWYALQVYSGHENKVRTLLEKRIAESADPNVIIHQVLVPTQEVMEIKAGKKTKKK